jgi:hypothetical protein
MILRPTLLGLGLRRILYHLDSAQSQCALSLGDYVLHLNSIYIRASGQFASETNKEPKWAKSCRNGLSIDMYSETNTVIPNHGWQRAEHFDMHKNAAGYLQFRNVIAKLKQSE